ncbi:MAG: CopG family antitoxin [Gemmatimonadota bacterium]
MPTTERLTFWSRGNCDESRAVSGGPRDLRRRACAPLTGVSGAPSDDRLHAARTVVARGVSPRDEPARTADYIDWSQARWVTFPNLKPSVNTISLRLPAAMSRPRLTAGELQGIVQ